MSTLGILCQNEESKFTVRHFTVRQPEPKRVLNGLPR